MKKVLLFCLLAASFTFAQRATWINAGAGSCSIYGADPFISVGASLNHQREDRLYSLRLTQNDEFKFFYNPKESVGDVSFLYGICSGGRSYSVSLQAGISIAHGINRGRYLYSEGTILGTHHHVAVEWFRPGIPFDASFFLRPTHFFGVGVEAYANLNSERSFAGFLFAVQVGKWK
jgi:hypothetical protein